MASTKRIMADLRVYGLGYLRDKGMLMNVMVIPAYMVVMWGVVLSSPYFSGGPSTSLTVFAPGLVSIAVAIAPLQSLVATSSSYKKNKLFQQFSMTPITKAEWLTSKALWFIVVTEIGFVPSFATAVIVFGANVSLSPWIIPFLALGAIFFTSLGMLIGTTCRSPETANMVAYVILLPMIFLSGVVFPVTYMPNYLQDIAHVLPQFYIVDGLNSVMIHSDYGQATIDLVIAAALAFIVSVLAVKLCKWKED